MIMSKMMKEQFLKFFKNQKELQRNSFGDIRRERFLFREMRHFFRKNRTEKKQKEKRRNKKEKKHRRMFTERDEKKTVEKATE